MSARERRAWAGRLSLAEDRSSPLLEQPADAAIVLLGDDYFDACASTGGLAGRRADSRALRRAHGAAHASRPQRLIRSFSMSRTPGGSPAALSG